MGEYMQGVRGRQSLQLRPGGAAGEFVPRATVAKAVPRNGHGSRVNRS